MSDDHQWVLCVGYKVDVHNSATLSPRKKFRFTAFDGDNTEYVADKRLASEELLERILRVVANRWPEKSVEVRVDERRVIRDIRSPSS